MKSLACIFGRHRWTTHEEHGDSYTVCSACGKIPKEPRPNSWDSLGSDALKGSQQSQIERLSDDR